MTKIFLDKKFDFMPDENPVDGSRNWGNLVDLAGIEPATSSMPWKRAPSCATGPLCEKKTPRRGAPSVFSPTSIA